MKEVKRGVSLLVVVAFFVTTLAGFALLAMVVPEARAEVVDCTWGQIKCCYRTPPCHNACCPRPKDPPQQG